MLGIGLVAERRLCLPPTGRIEFPDYCLVEWNALETKKLVESGGQDDTREVPRGGGRERQIRHKISKELQRLRSPERD